MQDSPVREQMDQVVLATVRPLSLGFGLFIAYTAFRERASYTGRDFALVVGADILVATYLLALSAWTWLRPPPLSWMNGLGASVGIALGGTDMVTMAVNGIPSFPATALVYAGLGAVVLSWRWLLGTLAGLWALWVTLAFVTSPDPFAAQFTLQIATITGIAIHWGRMRAYHGLIEARLNEAEARQRLQSANEELDRFASVVAHDLKNPVAAIRLKAAAIRIRLPEGDLAQRTTVQELDRVADGMSQMIDDLLTYARAGEPLDARELVDLTQVMEKVEALFSDQLGADGGRIDVRNLPALRGDPTLLFQLLENLVGNAVAHRSDDREPLISVTGGRADGGLTVQVQDNGPGFDPEAAERLFQPFERGETEAPGHGLGLATCRRIVEQHGGRIEASSVPGHGAVFKVWFPEARVMGLN